MAATIADLDSRITAGGGAGKVCVLRVPTDDADVSDALVAAEASGTKYTIILIEAAAPAGASAVTLTKPTKFIGTSDVAEIDFGATKVVVNFPAASELAQLEFQDLKISRSAGGEAFDISGDAVIRFNNCVITDDVVAVPTFAMFETAATKTLEVFMKDCLLQTTTANGLIFESGAGMTLHLDDTNANDATNSGKLMNNTSGLTLNMKNHSFIDTVAFVTTALVLTYDGTSIVIDNGEITTTSVVIHGVAYYDLRMSGLNVQDAIQDHLVPTLLRRKLIIGPGDYTMATAAVISVASLEIEGSGVSTALKVTAGTECITISASETTVKNLHIQLNASTLRGITITTGNSQTLSNIFFDNITGVNTDFIRITGGSDILIDKCIGAITAGSVQKFFFGDVGTGPVTVSNCITDGTTAGFRTDIARTIFDSCHAKIAATGNLFHIIGNDCIVSDCIGEGDGTAQVTGVFINADRVRSSNCTFKDVSTGYSINVGSDDIGIAGGTIKLIGGAGIPVTGISATTTTSFTVSNLIIDGSGNSNAGSRGATISGSTFKMSLLGLKIRNIAVGDGILFSNSAPVVTDSEISNCRIESVGGLGIHVKNMARVTVTSNHVRASGSDNIRLEVVTESNVSVNHCSGSAAGWGIAEVGAANFNLIGTNHCRGNSSGSVNVLGANSVESDTMS